MVGIGLGDSMTAGKRGITPNFSQGTQSKGGYSRAAMPHSLGSIIESWLIIQILSIIWTNCLIIVQTFQSVKQVASLSA
jgi:hypothetical protein